MASELRFLFPTTASDLQVVRAVLGGNVEAFAVVVERYQSRVFNLVNRMVGNRADAEDLSQEIFCKLYQNLHRFDQTQPLQNWLLRIASNHTINFLNQRRLPTTPIDREDSQGEIHPLQLPDHSPTPISNLERRQLGESLLDALQKLPETYRLVFILKYLDDLTAEDIAEIVGSPRNTVKTWIFRARDLLRAELEKSNQI
jgi:RNA polymerase sigma-70 factor (ECF subfamily)